MFALPPVGSAHSSGGGPGIYSPSARRAARAGDSISLALCNLARSQRAAASTGRGALRSRSCPAVPGASARQQSLAAEGSADLSHSRKVSAPGSCSGVCEPFPSRLGVCRAGGKERGPHLSHGGCSGALQASLCTARVKQWAGVLAAIGVCFSVVSSVCISPFHLCLVCSFLCILR